MKGVWPHFFCISYCAFNTVTHLHAHFFLFFLVHLCCPGLSLFYDKALCCSKGGRCPGCEAVQRQSLSFAPASLVKKGCSFSGERRSQNWKKSREIEIKDTSHLQVICTAVIIQPDEVMQRIEDVGKCCLQRVRCMRDSENFCSCFHSLRSEDQSSITTKHSHANDG